LKEIKNIVFDLGGVVLNIDFALTIDAFINLGVKNFAQLYEKSHQYPTFDKFDKGLISPVEFRNEMRKMLNLNLTDNQIDSAWNAILLDFPPDNIHFLNELKKSHRTFLLSNTNAIHYPVYTKTLSNNFGIADLSVLFEKTYFSFQVGLRKPDKEIFELLLNENHLIPEQTLFVDDSLPNIETASKLGIQTLLFIPEQDNLAMSVSKKLF